jgi:hypothetical protein
VAKEDKMDQAMAKRAKENTDRQLWGHGDVEVYRHSVDTLAEALQIDIATGEQFRINLSPLDRMIFEETIISGNKAILEHIPSHMPIHHRTARRLEVKFKVTSKDACLAAYMLYVVGRLEQEIIAWFESAVTTTSWNEAFAELHTYFKGIRECDSTSVDVMGKVETGLPEGGCYHAVPLVMPEEPTDEQINEQDELYSQFSTRIRRAGVHQLGAIGKEMYAVNMQLGFDNSKALWAQYNARKAELAKYRKGA